MKTINLEGLDKTLYQETLLNGLDIYLIPYEDKKNYYISYATRYGSDVMSFITEAGEFTPPLGVAHYLEHKMFEEQSGEDPFTFFSNSGSDGNASTSYEYTQYICRGNKNFEDNLRYLIKYVNNPYFTDKNVEKEKGIIAEELKMYNDIPDYKLEMKLRENIYHKSSRKYDIGGTVSEIKKITKEDLYKCYEAFYTPNNMFILITGNFDKEKALDIIKEELENKDSRPIPKVIYEKEPPKVVKEEDELIENIEIPKIAYSIKIPKKSINLKDMERDLYLSMLTTIIFGASSEFKERVRQNKILNEFYADWENEHDYMTYYILASSTDPDELLKEIKYELSHISIAKKVFERIKKVWIANEIKSIDNINKTQSNMFDDIINYGKIYENRLDIIKKMNVKVLESLLKKLDLKETCIIKMYSKNNKEIIEQ